MRVLVVDDDAGIRLVLRQALEDAEVVEAADGPAALEALVGSGPVDVVLLDVMLPGMSGLEVLGAIRGAPALRHVPVVMLTALAGDGDHLAAYGGGADAYVTKPFDLDEVGATLERLLETPEAERRRAREAETAHAELLVRIETVFAE